MDSNKKIIALSGGFDPPTRGQVAMIQEAAELGDVIIILNSDEWCATRRWDGKNFLPFKKRKSILLEIPGVINVVKSKDNDGTVCATLRHLNPDFFGNGGQRTVDNTPEVDVCKELGIGMLFFLGKNFRPTASEILEIAIGSAEANNEH
jgi:D-beta-D-heptose 7-phosphate kinase/D-beta-D-heptose 1-phosphate adenosyltransferase|tara:strand:+ start:1440 stop:1886 length:447 start_codon:yes stop_codon:yes gene_type:complete